MQVVCAGVRENSRGARQLALSKGPEWMGHSPPWKKDFLFTTTMTGPRKACICFSHTWFIYNLNTIFIRCEHTCAVIHIRTALLWILLCWPIPPPCFPLCPLSTPLHKWTTPFYLPGDPLFGDRGANVHPHSSLVGDRLPTPCSLTLPLPSKQYPQFMLHVYRDDITTSVTLSDTFPSQVSGFLILTNR
jgi:hypothetical protein